MQFCQEAGCRELVEYGRCQAHRMPDRPRRRHDRDPRYAALHKWYGLTRWQLLRKDVIREQPFCALCKRRLTQEIDHIQNAAEYPALFWDRANLQGLCKPCHTLKTNRGQ